MSLDIRVPIGLMFGIIGAILAVFGVFSNPAIYERSLGINVNLVWGCVLLAGAGLMLALAARARNRQAAESQQGEAPLVTTAESPPASTD